jgi:hypothetical protein
MTKRIGKSGLFSNLLLLSAFFLVVSGCGKEEEKHSSAKATDHSKKVAVAEAKETNNTADNEKKEEKAAGNTEQQKSDTAVGTDDSNKSTSTDKTSTQSTTTAQEKTTTSSSTSKGSTTTGTTQTKTASSTTTTKPSTSTTPPATSKPSTPTTPPATSKPTTPPPAPKPQQITFDTLSKFDNRSSKYTSVEEPQLSPLKLGNYPDTPITGSILLEMATFRASLSEMRSTIVGKADGNYKVTGVYSYTVTVPYLQTAYTTEEWNHGTYFYDRAKAAGLFNATFSGTRYDRVRGVIDVNHLEEGMKVTRVVITFEKFQ